MANDTDTTAQPDLKDKIAGQFQNLDMENPWLWPVLPRYTALTMIAVVVVVSLWFLWLSSFDEELESARKQELELRQDYTKKLNKAVNLELLKKQLAQVQQYVQQLEKQLPSKAEMDALLSDINQAGLGRSLTFEAFRPSQVNVKSYYAELPISVKVTGKFHDMGAFAADIAHLSRIVTLNNISITGGTSGRGGPSAPGQLSMTAIAKTFRYLDPEEVASQQRAAKAKKPGGKK